MSQDSFIAYRHHRWFWITGLVLAGLTGWYFSEEPLGGRNGGTTFGYTVGALSAILIGYLMWFGVRKRSYRSKITTLQGWLSAHVWIGVGLAYLVLLHSGFQIGINVHTLAYGLMLVTIASGIWGAANYRIVPYQTPSNRGGASLGTLLDQIEQVGREIAELAQGKSPSTAALLKKLNTGTVPSVWAVLLKPRREVVLSVANAAAAIQELPEVEVEAGHKLVELIDRRLELLHKLKREMRAQALLKIWLYFHIPIAFGTVVAVLIHIFVVLYYRDVSDELLNLFSCVSCHGVQEAGDKGAGGI